MCIRDRACREHMDGRKKQVFIARDQGPDSHRERGEESASYNGEGGGKVFKWYVKSVFLRHLALLDVELATCSERQCMMALAATSDELRRSVYEYGSLDAYAGPQCFPQLQDKARVDANQKRKADADDNVEADDANVEQLRGCWFRCDRCRKWRVVERECATAWRLDYFRGDVDANRGTWKEWLSRAGARHEAFQRERQGPGVAVGTAAQDSDTLPARAQEADGDDAFRGWAVRTGVGADALGADEQSEASDNSAAVDLEGLLGARGGGLDEADRRALDELLAGSEPFGSGSKTQAIAFRCEMLMARRAAAGEQKWRQLSCDDADDFLTLKSFAWSSVDYREHDRVELWPRDATEPPGEKSGFVRAGRVLTTVSPEGEQESDPLFAIAKRTCLLYTSDAADE